MKSGILKLFDWYSVNIHILSVYLWFVQRLSLALNACNKFYINVGCFDLANTILERDAGTYLHVLRPHLQYVHSTKNILLLQILPFFFVRAVFAINSRF
jgi:hypothetical protein